jgi:branched-chain amino acid transport system permease protein
MVGGQTSMEVLRFAVLGLGLGGAYALLALGVVAIYRGTGVPNFGQGAVGMFSAYTFFDLRDKAHWPTWAAALLTLAAAIAAGWLFYAAVMRKLRTAPILARIAATLALLLLLRGLALEFFDVATITPKPVLPNTTVRGWGIAIPEDRLLIAGIAIALGIVLSILSVRTRIGLAVRAVADSEKGAQLVGLSPAMLGALTWGLGFALAALAGVVLSPVAGLDSNALTLLIVPVFGAALLARFSSFTVAVAGGLAIGMAQSVLQLYANSTGSWISELWSGVGRAQAFPALVIILGIVISGRLLPSRGDPRQGRLPISLTPRYRRTGPVAVLIVGTLWITFSSAPWLSAGVVTMAGGLIALSVVLVTGFVGQVSLAQFAIAGIGGLIAARLSASLPLLVVLLVSAIAAGLVGFILGLPSVRVRGQSLALVTLGAAYICQTVIFQDPRILGGSSGYPLVHPAALFGHRLDPKQFAFLTLIIVILIGCAVAAIRASSFGRRSLAVRENEAAAIASGANVAWFKLVGFTASSAIAGLAGCLLSYHALVFAPSEFDTFASLNIVVVAYIGGIGMVGGALIAGIGANGGIFAQLLTTHGASSYQEIIAGAGLLIALQLHPDGIASTGHAVRAHLAKRRGNKAAAGNTSSTPHPQTGTDVVRTGKEVAQ